MRYRSTSVLAPLFSVSLGLLSCGGSTTTPPPSECGGTGSTCEMLTSYACTSTGISFATDILPILQDMGNSSGTSPGCSQTLICHGTPPIFIDTAMTVTQSFLDPPAMVKAALLENSVNAPTMKRVVPGDVGASFLAYKISGATALACVNAMCSSGASVGTSVPCGDPMPTAGIGTLTAAQRTMIIDWIAQGAAD